MTKKEKELLMRDLCSRLPYGIKVESNSYKTEIIGIKGTGIYTRRGIIYPINVIKPYLRPMSSMTEEEEETYQMFFNEEGLLNTSIDTYLDWLLEGHFDFRGLIAKGLAIAAVGENNPY